MGIDIYYEIIKKNPKFYWAYIKVGEILILQNKLDEAIKNLLQAIEINPSSTAASSILEQAQVKKMSNINVNADFQTDYYCATLEEGKVVFRSKQSLKTICRLASYVCEYATIYRVYYGIKDYWIELDTTDNLQVGDTIEIRNEFQSGRANFPVVHTANVVEIDRSRIRIDTLPKENALFTEKGVFIWKRAIAEITQFEITQADILDEASTWIVNGNNNPIAVSIKFSFEPHSQEVSVTANRKFLKSLDVINERLVWNDLPALCKVYRKNRKIDSKVFQRCYNVDKQGALFWEENDVGLQIYHVPEISSLSVYRPSVQFKLRSISKFFNPPHDISAATPDIHPRYYASAVSYNFGDVQFSSQFDRVTKICGLKICWYNLDSKPKSVTVSAKQGEAKITFQCAPDSVVDNFYFDQVFECEELFISVSPHSYSATGVGRVYIRVVDFMVDGADFDLVVNLDDYRDHRFYNHLEPELRKGAMINTTENHSTSHRNDKDTSVSQFSLRLGKPSAILPRLMHIPFCSEALLLWTEHADRACINTHRAAYFGRSDIDIIDAKDAIGGFVRWGIPVTKSVYYANPSKLPCSKAFPYTTSSMLDDLYFQDFCFKLAKLGYEICPHAPQPDNSLPNAAKETVEYFSDNFQSQTWIDHSPLAIHCGLSGQGAKQQSPYYMAKIWKDFGFQYFWQTGSEDMTVDEGITINSQQIRLGDWCHTPLYWRHSTETGDLISWISTRGGSLKGYSEQELDSLINEHGVCINHTYPGALYEKPYSFLQYLKIADDGTARSSAFFDTVLKRIHNRISEGKIHASTIAKILNYWVALESVEILFDKDETTILKNNSNTDIEGFTIAVEQEVNTSINSNPELKVRNVGKDTLICFTFKAGGILKLQEDTGKLVLLFDEETDK